MNTLILCFALSLLATALIKRFWYAVFNSKPVDEVPRYYDSLIEYDRKNIDLNGFYDNLREWRKEVDERNRG